MRLKTNFMKKSIHLLISIIIITVFITCSKKGGGGGTSKEDNIAFTIDASNGSILPGSSFSFNAKLTSAMPAQGIKIEITANDDVSGSNITPQNAAVQSSSITTSVSVINLPQQKWVDVTVRVSSVATPTNYATQTFKVVYK